jgi:hypothetical protein
VAEVAARTDAGQFQVDGNVRCRFDGFHHLRAQLGPICAVHFNNRNGVRNAGNRPHCNFVPDLTYNLQDTKGRLEFLEIDLHWLHKKM